MADFQKDIEPIAFPRDGEEWTEPDSTTLIPNLTQGSTFLYKPNSMTYTYNSNFNTWTGG